MPSEVLSPAPVARGPADPMPTIPHVGHLPVLTFHAIEASDSPIAFPGRLFAELLRLAAEHGYRTISLGAAQACLAAGTGFPARSVVMTFDDGYRSVFAEAYPRLRDHGFSATLFLTVGETSDGGARERMPSLGGREMLNWDEVTELAKAGWEIGAHSLSHPDLRRIPLAHAIREMSESKRRIEQRLGSTVTAFAYPYGRSNACVREWLAREYLCACGVSPGLVSSHSDPLALPRLDMYYLRSRILLPLLFSPWLPPYLLLRRIPRRLRALIREGLGT